MFCVKCGNALPEGATFCTSCGAQQTVAMNNNNQGGEIRPPEIYSQYPSSMPAEPPAKPKKKGGFLKFLLVFVLIIAVLGGVTVLSYYTFLPAKYTLMVAGNNTLNKAYEAIDKNLAYMEEKRIKPIFENSFRADTEISFSIEDALLEQLGLPQETVELISKSLKNISLTYGHATDYKNKLATAQLGVNYSKNPALTANFFIDDTKFGLSVPQLSEVTITGDLKKLDNLADLLYIDPIQIEAFKSMDPWISERIYKEIKINREDIKKLMFDYSKEFIDNIDSSDMSIKRGKSTKVLGKSMTCQEVTIKLDPKAQKKLVSKLLEKLEKDKTVYNLTFGNVKKLFDILGENEYYKAMLEELDIEEILSKDKYEEVISGLIDSLDEADEEDFPENVSIKIYISGLDIVKYVVDVTTGEDEHTFTFEDKIDGLSFEKKLSVVGGAEGNNGEVALLVKKTYDEKSDTKDVTVDFNFQMDSPDSPGALSFVYDSKEEPRGKNEVEHTVEVSFKVDAMEYGSPIKIDGSLTLNGTQTRNSKGLVTEYDYTGKVGIKEAPELPMPVEIGFAANGEAAYGEKVEIPAANKTLDLATATQEDLYELENEVYEKIGALSMLLGGF